MNEPGRRFALTDLTPSIWDSLRFVTEVHSRAWIHFWAALQTPAEISVDAGSSFCASREASDFILALDLSKQKTTYSARA